MTDTVASPASRPAIGAPWLRWGLVSIPLVDRLQVQGSGHPVRLAVIPVDPRDLLRGDYVIINLAIGRVSREVPGSDAVSSGDVVYVGLSSGGERAAEPVLVAKSREDAGDLAISGTVLSVHGDEIRIDYGIDAFFLPEGEGLEIERMDTSRILLEVSVADDGRSLPINLLVDGAVFKSDAIF
jgi:uncharacterized membrane-anchored protein